ncbi:hypothetical protein Tco_0925658 [Tanacetum coccineum]|uniref:Uncharacterized protein n=1 Tax=Tanacetum coccineum TaxID=301880 RepID=A0ABQ5D8J7_9ASTR
MQKWLGSLVVVVFISQSPSLVCVCLLEMFASVEHVLMALIEVEGYDKHLGSIVGLVRDLPCKYLSVVGPTEESLTWGDSVHLSGYVGARGRVPLNNAQDSAACFGHEAFTGRWSMILHDVVGTSGYRCRVLRSFLMEGIKPKKACSKILPCGGGSCRKTFKPVASLIAKGKLK